MDLQDALADLGDLLGFEGVTLVTARPPSSTGTVSPHDVLISRSDSTSPSSSSEPTDETGERALSDHPGSNDVNVGNNGTCYSPFPRDNTVTADRGAVATTSLPLCSKSVGDASKVANGRGRHVSVPANSPGGRKRRMSPINGKDISSQLERRRSRNNIAARGCRERKARRLERLLKEVSRLEAECARLKDSARRFVGGSPNGIAATDADLSPSHMHCGDRLLSAAQTPPS
ncbi:uncharacterized protein PG998_006315 [Apiospora kogelbergensis]|uniref:uncharacterized protein n=1 Tax=Apiospora kogelbergensis TaxID=1337665 RepID=UPI00312D865F